MSASANASTKERANVRPSGTGGEPTEKLERERAHEGIVGSAYASTTESTTRSTDGRTGRPRVMMDGRPSLVEWLKAYALLPLPQHLLSRAVFWLTRRESSLTTPVVRRFAKAFDVEMQDAVEPDLTAYPTFNAFFTRALTPAARPIADGPAELASPADGRVSALGDIVDARVLQAKGIDYSLLALLGGDGEASERLGQGSFATVYLSPRDYHRLHMPSEGTLLRQTHVPGRLFSVGPHAVKSLDGLFTRNERVVTVFDTPHGLMALVLVGAINVAAIETVWHGLITPPAGRSVSRIDYKGDERVTLARGEEMGRFNMGSTVIVLTERRVDWHASLAAEAPVRMGQAIGESRSSDRTADRADG